MKNARTGKTIAKTILSAMLLSGLLLTAAGCQRVDSNGEKVVLPPRRYGRDTSYPSWARSYTFEEALSEAEAVARIEVGNWIGEEPESRFTYYEVRVLECFKGNLPEKFTLAQEGCASSTYPGYPLFIKGNELFVCLKQTVDPKILGMESDEPYYKDYEKYGSHYYIEGSILTLMDVSYDEAGNRYYLPRFDMLGESMTTTKNYATQAELAKEVYDCAVEKDPVVADLIQDSPYIFSAADVTAMIGGYNSDHVDK